MNTRRSPAPLSRTQASAGFTLFETVIVLLLLGILSAAVLPKMFSTSSLTLKAQAQTLASDLQRAQQLATTSGQNVYVCATTSAYLVQVGMYLPSQACPPSFPALPQPPNQPVVVYLANNATLTAPNPALWYDSKGQPSSGANFALSGTYTVSVTNLSGLVSMTPP